MCLCRRLSEAYIAVAISAALLAAKPGCLFSRAFCPDPLALAVALALEALDRPRLWRGHLVTNLIPPQIHPVSLVFKTGARLIGRGGLLRGVLVLITTSLPLTAAAVLYGLARGDGILWSVLEGYLLKLSFSITHITYGCLMGYDGGMACAVVKEFVRRDLSGCEKGLVHSACIETAAESLVDSFASTLFWYGLLGLPGAWLQRSVNTADGLVGFRQYGPLGLPSALADTLMNFLPARLTSFFLLGVGGLRAPHALCRMERVESINARWPLASIAVVLAVKLEKAGYYSIEGGGYPQDIDVYNALRLVNNTALAIATFTILAVL